MLALMREDNANADLAKPESEVDAFGCVHQIISEMSAGGSEPTVITEDDVMDEIAEVGYGNLSHAEWQHLARFRLVLPEAIATMLLDSLFHVCNGRVKSCTENYARICALHLKKSAWPKTFILLDLYCGSLVSDSKTNEARAEGQSHRPPNIDGRKESRQGRHRRTN